MNYKNKKIQFSLYILILGAFFVNKGVGPSVDNNSKLTTEGLETRLKSVLLINAFFDYVSTHGEKDILPFRVAHNSWIMCSNEGAYNYYKKKPGKKVLDNKGIPDFSCNPLSCEFFEPYCLNKNKKTFLLLENNRESGIFTVAAKEFLPFDTPFTQQQEAILGNAYDKLNMGRNCRDSQLDNLRLFKGLS